MKQSLAPLAVVVAALLAGCNDETPNSPADPQFVPGQGSASLLDAGLRDVAMLAIEALATDLGISNDRIAVDTIRPVDWPDSSIGCPQPGQAYLQVIMPGNKITLRADGQFYVVHQAGNRAFVCHKTKDVGGLTPQLELVFSEQMLVARKDLAARLGVPESEIRPSSAEKKTWDDASLGCPEPGVQYAQESVDGWIMKFKYRDRDFTYHTDMKRTIPCPAIAAE